MRTVSVIGCGEIGGAVVRGIADLDGWDIGRVLTRRPVPNLSGHTMDPEVFFSHPVNLIIDTAGPGALRSYGLRALALAPVWSVGAVAMADPSFRAGVASVSQSSGHELWLFGCGMANIPLSAQRLHMTMRGPEIEVTWTGILAEAVARWPDQLNTAVAAALNGPGLEATELTMESNGPDVPHEIRVEAEVDGIKWYRTIRFDMRADVPHPVAQMLLGELARVGRSWQSV